MSTAQRVEEWLDEEQYPGAVWGDFKDKKNQLLLTYNSMNNSTVVYDCLEAANSETKTARCSTTIHGKDGEKPFIINYTISDVEVIEPCQDGHDFDEWSYDFMGGDIRKCERCGLHEHI